MRVLRVNAASPLIVHPKAALRSVWGRRREEMLAEAARRGVVGVDRGSLKSSSARQGRLMCCIHTTGGAPLARVDRPLLMGGSSDPDMGANTGRPCVLSRLAWPR